MGPTFHKIEPISKKARVLASLREAIVSGAIQGGDQLVEAKIAQEFGVGQGLIREALIELEHQGFVQRTPFSGTQVPKLTIEDAQNIFDIRIELEPLAFFLAGPKLTEEDLATLQQIADQSSAAAKLEDLDGFFEKHLNFRKKIWALSANPYLEQSLQRVVIPLYGLYLIRRTRNSEGLLQAVIDCVEHQEKILGAYRDRDFRLARRVARNFLLKTKNYMKSRG
jgi:DNA-binding GntR family transcriptional regulator